MARLTRILFICHGNICRSPMAQYVLADLVAQRGLQAQFVIDSAATSTEEIGNPVHPGTRKKLKSMGIPCGDHRARQVNRRELGKWDLFVCMDQANLRNTTRILGSGDKVYKLLEFAGSTRDVADPWYTGDFDATYEDVMDGCRGLLAYLGY